MSREAMQMALEMPMDIRVIKIIFKKMKLTYGKDFIDNHKHAQMQEVMQNWAKELAEFRPHEIAYGLERLPDKLPDVRQFRDVCRMAPPVWW